MQLPLSISNLIEEFAKLPTIGRKSAERLVFHLLRKSQDELNAFARALANVKINVTACAVCGCFAETSPCSICADAKRDRQAICVVTETRNIILLEQTGIFSGTYHVLGGLIDMARGITPGHLNIQPLLMRLKSGGVQEIILALNPTFEGETTALYLQKVLKEYSIKTTKLARGLPAGADIEYADEKTLLEALEHRH